MYFSRKTWQGLPGLQTYSMEESQQYSQKNKWIQYEMQKEKLTLKSQNGQYEEEIRNIVKNIGV